MTDLAEYKTFDGLDIFINLESQCFMNQKSIAKLCEVTHTVIFRYLSDTTPVVAALYDEDTILMCVAEFNPKLLIKLAKVGIRVYLHNKAKSWR